MEIVKVVGDTATLESKYGKIEESFYNPEPFCTIVIYTQTQEGKTIELNGKYVKEVIKQELKDEKTM